MFTLCGMPLAIRLGMTADDMQTKLDRAEYATIMRACVSRGEMTVAGFNDYARSIAHELADGECLTSGLWVMAARQVSAGARD